MSSFKKLTVNSLPRVMVAILAMDKDTREILAVEFTGALGKPFTEETMAERFHELLEMDKDAREALIPKINEMLNEQGDLFGTEGQCDPRGDRRDRPW